MKEGYLHKPEWIRMDLDTGKEYAAVKKGLKQGSLHTVCHEARCPNLHHCWGKERTATFMVLGAVCTRSCRFCAVQSGQPGVVDLDEPRRVAAAASEMAVHHAVITMVTRDDLPDGGAGVLARTVEALRALDNPPTVEVLSSDFGANIQSLETLAASAPEVAGHNLETVRRLSAQIRPDADYQRSLWFLSALKQAGPGILLKSSLMLGLGEEFEEILIAMDDLRHHGVEILNLGQYLQADAGCLPVIRYLHPDEFARLKEEALARGFLYCESGPLVRSSYHAGAQFAELLRRYKKNLSCDGI